MSWENAVARPGAGDKTVVVSLDDSRPGQIYVYVGVKQPSGNPVERAGLTDGKLYGIKVSGFPVETIAGIPSGTPFELVEIENQHLKQGVAIDSESRAKQITDFARPEDGAWDPRDPNAFYWVTTGMPVNNTPVPARLWRLRFDDAQDPAAGGTIDLLLDGTEGTESLDNLTVDHWRRVLIQEDRAAILGSRRCGATRSRVTS